MIYVCCYDEGLNSLWVTDKSLQCNMRMQRFTHTCRRLRVSHFTEQRVSVCKCACVCVRACVWRDVHVFLLQYSVTQSSLSSGLISHAIQTTKILFNLCVCVCVCVLDVVVSAYRGLDAGNIHQKCHFTAEESFF